VLLLLLLLASHLTCCTAGVTQLRALQLLRQLGGVLHGGSRQCRGQLQLLLLLWHLLHAHLLQQCAWMHHQLRRVWCGARELHPGAVCSACLEVCCPQLQHLCEVGRLQLQLLLLLLLAILVDGQLCAQAADLRHRQPEHVLEGRQLRRHSRDAGWRLLAIVHHG
jgi:hypothetical protein